jgi:hypothetical protein
LEEQGYGSLAIQLRIQSFPACSKPLRRKCSFFLRWYFCPVFAKQLSRYIYIRMRRRKLHDGEKYIYCRSCPSPAIGADKEGIVINYFTFRVGDREAPEGCSPDE